MAVLWKEIKPKRLKVAAFRLAFLNEMRKVGTEVKRDFEKTTATWSNKPKFDVTVSLTAPGPLMSVETDDKIYRFVDKGTKDHFIPAGKKALRFQPNYSAKTRIGFIGSSSGGASGDFVFSKGHKVSGIKARKFSKEIEKKWTPKFKRRMEATMAKVAKSSGHAL